MAAEMENRSRDGFMRAPSRKSRGLMGFNLAIVMTVSRLFVCRLARPARQSCTHTYFLEAGTQHDVLQLEVFKSART